MRWTLRAGGLAAGIALTVVVAACGPGRTGRFRVEISADRTWTPTTVSVRKGDRLDIYAMGRIEAGKDASCGPEGFADRPDWARYSVLQSAPHLALIGRIGDGGKPFAVGQHADLTADATGVLYLGVNDRDAANNRGRLTVVVVVE